MFELMILNECIRSLSKNTNITIFVGGGIGDFSGHGLAEYKVDLKMSESGHSNIFEI